ncbi:hypothetical protein [Arenimonas oryziterrae]|uniref:Uncharacterized protein n=1 Tax=Arenimonas oryziterrae DSM 21050 = YC6267 TaxID=1121015 RepID=A0A091AQZ9_9GAMM|nr:hypothetical protein [Arenimonas oryziterrae]KFN42598.1 hypothetical protein N789_13235 [Arenimonas oryziterrae DSM 21050 = YC6267]
MPLKDPPKRPDPAIYSQELVVAAGQVPTWDPKDLRCLWVGGEWEQQQGGQSSHFFPTLIAKPRNIGEAQAINITVRASTSRFGIGLVREALPMAILSLPPGAAGEVRILIPENFPQDLMRPPGLHVELLHPHDKDESNNRCSYNVARIRTVDEGRVLSFECPVRNPTEATATIQLRSYASAGVTINAPASITLAAGEQQAVTVGVVVSPTIHGTDQQALDLEATLIGSAPGFLDGVTWNLLVHD